MVDLTRNTHGAVQARLLDLVPGRTGKRYASWLAARSNEFRYEIKVAPLDPFAEYKRIFTIERFRSVSAPVVSTGPRC